MANTNQSIKRARQNDTRRRRGQSIRARCRTMIKKVKAAGGNAESFRNAFIGMQSAIDRAADKKMLHRNKVARIKRRANRRHLLLLKTAEAA